MSDQHCGADQGGGDPPKKSGVPGLRVPPGFENLASSQGTGASGLSGKCSVGDLFCPREGCQEGSPGAATGRAHETRVWWPAGQQPRVVQHSWVTGDSLRLNTTTRHPPLDTPSCARQWRPLTRLATISRGPPPAHKAHKLLLFSCEIALPSSLSLPDKQNADFV